MKRSSPLRSRTPVKPVNRKRKARLFKEDFHSREFVEWIHGWACANCGVSGYSEAAHTRSRGAGGKASDIIPLCANRHGVEGCHSLYDRRAPEIEEYRLRLRSLAKHYWNAFNRKQEIEESA